MFNNPYLDPDGNPQVMQFQGNLKPILLWEYAFPRGYENIMLRSLNLGRQEHATQWIDKYGLIMRKMLKAEKYPKKADIPEGTSVFIPKTNIQIYGIGYRKDIQDAKFPDGTTREMI